MADRRPLIQESSDLSESSDNTPALPSLGFSNNSHSLGLASPPPARPSHVRYQSDTTAVGRNTPSIVQEEDEEEEIADGFQRERDGGLGIAASSAAPHTARRVSIQPIPRRAVGPGPKSPPTKSPGTFSPATPGDQYFGNFPKSSTESTPDLRRDRFSPEVGRASPDIGSYEEFRHGILKNAKQSNTSVDDFENYIHASDTDGLRAGGGAAPSIKSAYENDFRPIHECPTTKDFYHPKFTWLNMSIFIICIFSCIFSGFFLALAIHGPHYGHRITSHGPITPSDAILITTVMAKLIELSFVTAFVAFLGQVLSRRAFMKEHGRGVTLSELSMWRWVVQPGTLLTHPEAAKYAGLSFLGILSLLSTILATLYSSAAAALVQPMLREGNWDNGLVLAGNVKSDFANIDYIKKMCESPIRYDPEKGGTCVQLQHAGQGYHNFQFFLSSWDLSARNGNGTADLSLRPQGIGLLHENTLVSGQWINVVNTTKVSKKYGRVINNITMAMPHSGIFTAARDQRNGILQPAELNSEGTYSLRATVPSPTVNVLCANMNSTELEPIVYQEWPNAEDDIASWLAPSSSIRGKASTQNTTVVDEIFGWNGSDPTTLNWPPVFGKLPIEFNTVTNHTSNAWGRPAIYLLGQGGPAGIAGDGTGIYSLCKIQVSVIPGCSTRHNVTGSGGTMEVLCDEDDKMSFVETGEEPSKNSQGVANWRDIGTDWANSLSLGTGLMDANASTSRLLTQLILLPEDPDPENLKADLSKALPSIAEALAVLSGSTLLLSMVDTPFVTFWNYTHPALDEYQTQYFKASLRAQQYASGGMPGASRAWIIILALVFAMNIFVLIYFILHRGLVTDFSEPPNLFALAVNSPPSHVLAGSCGGGPQGKQYMVNWFVNHEGSHLYMEPGEKTPLLAGHGHAHMHDTHDDGHHDAAPRVVKGAGGVVTEVTEKLKRGFGLRRQRAMSGRLRSGNAVEGLRRPVVQTNTTTVRPGSVASAEFEMEDGLSRTSRAYQKLAKRRSML